MFASYGNVFQAEDLLKQQLSIECILCKVIMTAVKKLLSPKARVVGVMINTKLLN